MCLDLQSCIKISDKCFFHSFLQQMLRERHHMSDDKFHDVCTSDLGKWYHQTVDCFESIFLATLIRLTGLYQQQCNVTVASFIPSLHGNKPNNYTNERCLHMRVAENDLFWMHISHQSWSYWSSLRNLLKCHKLPCLEGRFHVPTFMYQIMIRSDSVWFLSPLKTLSIALNIFWK